MVLKNKNSAESVLLRRSILGSFLQTRRENAGLSQKDVATRLGYSTPQFVSNWERGVSSPPLDIFPRLARFYKLSEKTVLNAVHEYHRALLAKQRSDIKKAFSRAR